MKISIEPSHENQQGVPDVSIWMPQYHGEWYSETAHLSTEQIGAYDLLVAYQWRNGPLPHDDDLLRQVTRLDPDAWARSRSILLALFATLPDGRLVRQRIESLRLEAQQKRRVYQERASKGGKATARNRASSTTSSTRQAVPEMHTSPSPSPLPAPAPKTPTPEEKEASRSDQGAGVLYKKAPLLPAAGSLQKPDADEIQQILTAVSDGTGISSKWVLEQIAIQASSELQAYPDDSEGICKGMVEAWREYQACSAAGKLRGIAMGAERFYGEGKWRSPKTWNLKKGQRAYAA